MEKNLKLIRSYLMNIINDIYSIIFIFLIGVYYLLKQLILPCRPKQGFKMRTGQIAVVTGGLQGIGFEVVGQLMKHGMHVFIGAPETSKVEELMKDLEKHCEGIVEYIELDLGSLKSIASFADKILERQVAIQILVNNSGIMFGSYLVTTNGFESQLGINFLGHLYLIYKLLPRLRQSSRSLPTRIVNVSSCCHYAGRINFIDLTSREYYSSYSCYAQSKLAIVMTTIYLNNLFVKHDIPITVNSVHPGVVNTNLYRNTFFRFLSSLTQLLFKSPEEGAMNVVYVALADEIEGIGGKYFEDCKIQTPNRLAKNEKLQEKLWKESCKMLRIKNFL